MKNSFLLLALFSLTFFCCKNSKAEPKKEVTNTPSNNTSTSKNATPSSTKEIGPDFEKNRMETITKLFSDVEQERKDAANDLVFDYAKEDGLVRVLVNYAMKNENFQESKKNSLWQTTYILTQMTSRHLIQEGVLVEEFIEKMVRTNWATGKNTMRDFQTILGKMKG